MAHPSGLNQLVEHVKGLSLDSVAEKYPGAHPEVNPLDLYKAHLSNVLASISDIAPATVYSVVQWTQSLDKGDFVVATPALRVKGKKPDVLANELLEKARLPSPLLSGSHVASF